ncbi:hypothetical protein NF556_16705 [Ornithinimicrobium faecis]|uniref:DNA-binding protein n=1 Tax=Ornithinimicrobium faecis TaxID=2934158 RepID=A0ABY4YRA6_9MICO|nr:hypothetical protein [Ornithinimicrobium sp. HY1793]USQ79238.1 hypothetical protein NF556_16705 [Ornithinimicrobium sp. HY1793]
MTTRAQLRKAALGHLEVGERTHLGKLAFFVMGKKFVTVTKDGVVQLWLPGDRVVEALTRHPQGERFGPPNTTIGFAIALKDINGMHLNNLVDAAWAHRAPPRFTAARQDGTGEHDLPAAIGAPATRALLLAGISTLDEADRRTDEELLALHGVGPRAVARLRQAVRSRAGTA